MDKSCEAIYEPDWRTGTAIPTRFTAAGVRSSDWVKVKRKGAIAAERFKR